MNKGKKDAPNSNLDDFLGLDSNPSSGKKENSMEDKDLVATTASPLEAGDLVVDKDKKVKKVHVLSGVKVLATDDEVAEYHKLHSYVAEALEGKNISDLSHDDLYWDAKDVLDGFVAHLERA